MASIQTNKRDITNEEEIEFSLNQKKITSGRIKRLCSLKAIQGKRKKSTTLHILIGRLIHTWDVHLSLFTSCLFLDTVAGGNRPASFPKSRPQERRTFRCSPGQLRRAPHCCIILGVGGHELFKSQFEAKIPAQLS
ncbi:hypothetical protein Dimus_039459 [Dionaea muscipula]